MKMNLLIVEDKRMIRSAIAEYLEDIGHAVDTAKNATSAMERIASQHYDIIITDLSMPDFEYNMENGLYLLKYAKQHLPDVEVIVMSGNPCLEVSLTAIKYGAFYFFSKPFSLGALNDKIEIIRHMKIGNPYPASQALG